MMFNIYEMKGKTEEDNAILMSYLERDLEDTLSVDDFGRVWDGSGKYIADSVTTEPGNGIGC